MTDKNKTPDQPNRLVTLRWFDAGSCPDQHLADLVSHFETRDPDDNGAITMGLFKPMSTTIFVQGNAVDIKITPFRGLIALDTDLYPVLTNGKLVDFQTFARATFSLSDMNIDSGDKLFSLREFIRFVQHHFALPGMYIGLSLQVVQEITYLAYWKSWPLELRLDKRGDRLVMAVHFTKAQDMDFVINFLRENDSGFDPYPFTEQWLGFFRDIASEVADLWTIRIVVNKSIAEKIGCINDSDIVITSEELLPYPCQ